MSLISLNLNLDTCQSRVNVTLVLYVDVLNYISVVILVIICSENISIYCRRPVQLKVYILCSYTCGLLSQVIQVDMLPLASAAQRMDSVSLCLGPLYVNLS